MDVQVVAIRDRADGVDAGRSPDGLDRRFNLRDAPAVRRFLGRSADLISLLDEAFFQLQKQFGRDVSIALEVISDPEGEDAEELFGYVSTALAIEDAIARLDRFDESWFLDHLPILGGRLNFNLEFL